MQRFLKSNVFKCIVSGLLLALSWPPVSFTPLLFLSFLPLLFVLNKTSSVKKSWGYAYLTLFVWTLSTMYWIGNTKLDARGLMTIFIAWTLIPLFQSLPFLIFGWIKQRVTSPLSWFFLPFIWVCYEYLHSSWQFSFTWLHLGFGLSPWPWIIQFYEITGYLGGSFLIMTVNVLIFLIINSYGKRLFRKLLYAGLALLLVADLLLYPRLDSRDSIKVAIIQSNDDPYQVLDKSSLKRQVGVLQKLTEPLAGKKIDLVVLSEGFLRTSPSGPLVLNNIDEQPAVKAIKEISKKIDAPILLGFIGYKLFDNVSQAPVASFPTGDGRYFSGYNGAMLVAYDQPTQIQMKNNLVPFMERIPYLEQLSFFEKFKLKLNQAKNSYEKDDIVNVFRYKNMRIATLICLDALFPAYAAKFIDQEANVVAIIANDSWAGNTSGYRQNAQYASAVATSLRRNVIRCATTGQSMFVSRSGARRQITDWSKREVVIDQVNLSREKTAYVRAGDWIGIASTLLTVLAIVAVSVWQRIFAS